MTRNEYGADVESSTCPIVTLIGFLVRLEGDLHPDQVMGLVEELASTLENFDVTISGATIRIAQYISPDGEANYALSAKDSLQVMTETDVSPRSVKNIIHILDAQCTGEFSNNMDMAQLDFDITLESL